MRVTYLSISATVRFFANNAMISPNPYYPRKLGSVIK